MPETQLRVCPECKTQVKYFRKRRITGEDGKDRPAGEYYSCYCFALTYSPLTGKFNLRN